MASELGPDGWVYVGKVTYTQTVVSASGPIPGARHFASAFVRSAADDNAVVTIRNGVDSSAPAMHVIPAIDNGVLGSIDCRYKPQPCPRGLFVDLGEASGVEVEVLWR